MEPNWVLMSIVLTDATKYKIQENIKLIFSKSCFYYGNIIDESNTFIEPLHSN